MREFQGEIPLVFFSKDDNRLPITYIHVYKCISMYDVCVCVPLCIRPSIHSTLISWNSRLSIASTSIACQILEEDILKLSLELTIYASDGHIHVCSQANSVQWFRSKASDPHFLQICLPKDCISQYYVRTQKSKFVSCTLFTSSLFSQTVYPTASAKNDDNQHRRQNLALCNASK